MFQTDPELAAAELLAAADICRPPVNPVELCRRWPGLRLSLAELDGAGYLVDLGSHGGELLIRRSDPEFRQRYTCAHELGHWVLQQHPELVDPRAGHATIERWCDRFAASLLMPATWIIESLGERPRIESITALPGRFGVSRRALFLRVGEVSPFALGIASRAAGRSALTWSTEEAGGRFEWLGKDWIAETLQNYTSPILIREQGLEFQATRLSGSTWLVLLAATAALTSWRAAHTYGGAY